MRVLRQVSVLFDVASGDPPYMIVVHAVAATPADAVDLARTYLECETGVQFATVVQVDRHRWRIGYPHITGSSGRIFYTEEEDS